MSASPRKLNAVIAVARGVKTRVHEAVTALHRESQKVDLYAGLTRAYQPLNDEAERLPGEGTRHQLDATTVLGELRRLLTEAWNAEGTLVRTSNDAYADVSVDGVVLLPRAPLTYLLYLEKQLNDVYTFIARLPVLDPAESWHWDEARGCWATDPVKTKRTSKVPRSLVLHEGTEHHPPQVHVYHEDVIEGYWATVRFSGALPVDRKREVLLRVVRLKDAVREARERGALADAVDFTPAETLLGYVLDSPTDAPRV